MFALDPFEKMHIWRRTVLWALAAMFISLLPGCGTYPGGTETKELPWSGVSGSSSKTFDTFEGAKRFAEMLQTEVVAYSSSNKDMKIHSVEFVTVGETKGSLSVFSDQWRVMLKVDYKIAVHAEPGQMKSKIAIYKDGGDAEMAEAVLSTKVFKSKFRAKGLNGFLELLFGLVLLSLSWGVLSDDEIGCVSICVGIITLFLGGGLIVVGVWHLMEAFTALVWGFLR